MAIYAVDTSYAVVCDRVRELIVPHYGDVDPHQTGGTWFVYDRDSEWVACVWALMQRPFAYIDYLACRSGRGHGLRLAAILTQTMLQDGYTRVLANVHEDNDLMVRAIARLQGHAPDNGPYYLVDLARR